MDATLFTKAGFLRINVTSSMGQIPVKDATEEYEKRGLFALLPFVFLKAPDFIASVIHGVFYLQYFYSITGAGIYFYGNHIAHLVPQKRLA